MLYYRVDRGNNISSSHCRENYPQELLPVFQSLCDKEGEKAALEVIERMSKLNKFRPEETNSALRICKWTKPSRGVVL